MGDLVFERTNITLYKYQVKHLREIGWFNLSGAVREFLDDDVMPPDKIPPERHQEAVAEVGGFDIPEYQRDAVREEDIDVREVLVEALDERIESSPRDARTDGGQSDPVSGDTHD